MSRAKTLHGGIDATDVRKPKGNMDTINVWVAVGPTTTNGLVRTAEVITPAIFRPQGDGTANGEANGVEIIMQEGKTLADDFNSILTTSERIEGVDDGVGIGKFRTWMNDTANTAIATQLKFKDRSIAALQEILGMTAWNSLPEEYKVIICARCTHHLRCLLETESDQHTDQRLKK